MKAIGTRLRSPNSRGRYRGEAEYATEGETVCSQQGSGRASDEDDGGGGDAVARVCTTTQDVGTAVNHGIFPEVSLPNPEFQGEKITEMEGMDGLMSGGDDLSPSTDELGVSTRPMNQIEANGPQRGEKQSSWTRLTHMDFGPVDLLKERAKSILGKRGSQGMQHDMFDKGD